MAVIERKNRRSTAEKSEKFHQTNKKKHLSALFESLTTAIFADDLFIHSPHCSPLSLSGFDFFLSYWAPGAESARHSLPTRLESGG